ncbi:MAG: hypothetical protein JW819_08860 [Candidatus Krumholzibacteriota bacterium]|nr:hypothetical protein [Candidatus Krumholzibacteriota bacterium]
MDNEALVAVFRLDSECRRLERALAELPAAGAALRREGNAARERRAARDSELADLDQGIRRLEREIVEIEDRRRREENKLRDLSTVEHVAAKQREIDALAARIESLELRVLEKIESQEILQRETELRRSTEGDADAARERELGELERDTALQRHALERTRLDRERALAGLEPTLARRYKRAFGKHGHGCVAALRDGSCGGCGEALPPQDALDLRHKGRVLDCQGCGRLILWVES